MLVKWWLLAVPHYLIVGVFVGGGWAIWTGTNNELLSLSGGLIGLLVLIAGIMLLFTGRYPKSLYDFVLGMDRWVFRVAAYVTLMTDSYPPFRLDQGGDEPATSAAPDAEPTTLAISSYPLRGAAASARSAGLTTATSSGSMTAGMKPGK